MIDKMLQLAKYDENWTHKAIKRRLIAQSLVLSRLPTCCSKFILVALSFDENSFTTQGTIFFWYSTSSSSLLSLNRGAKTADPAPPNSKAFKSCGRILCLEKFFGNESKCLLSSAKKSFLWVASMIWTECERKGGRTVHHETWGSTWTSSILSAMLTNWFDKYPPCSRNLLNRSAGFGRDFGLALTISQ